MQERRSTIRLSCQGRVHHGSSDSSFPRDGRMRDLSAGGIGLLVDESPGDGERITVHIPLSGQHDRLTATGVVRWSGARSCRGQQHPIGLEWLPLDGTTRLQLQTLLEEQAQRRPAGRHIPLVWAGLGALVAGWFSFWLLSVRQENRQLQQAIRQRDTLIEQRGREGHALQRDLEAATLQMASAMEELVRLEQHTQRLEGHVEQMTQDVDRMQQSYDHLRQEREALMQRILNLEQERQAFAGRLSSIPDAQARPLGNHGFLIRVHDPELP